MNAVDHNNVVIFDDRGIPSIMCRFARPKDAEEVPAVFKIGDKVADAIYISKYPNTVIDGRAYSMPMADPTANITFDEAVQACRCKGAGWHLMTAVEYEYLLNQSNYGSVNRNDNNHGMSIGKCQWNAYWGRALPLLKSIVEKDQEQAKEILGDALYTEIAGSSADAWNRQEREATEEEANAISKLLTTKDGKEVQDGLADADITGYVKNGVKIGLVSLKALAYFADLENQGGSGASSRIAKTAAEATGGAEKVGLEEIHAYALKDATMGQYESRRSKVYEAIKGSNLTDVSHTKTEEKQNTPQKPQETPTGVSKGDIVTFTGGGVYISSTAEYAAKEKDVVSTCKVTAVNEKGTHKYHCISQDGKGVYGWVNAESIKELSSKAHSDPASVSKGDIVTFTGGGVYKSSTAEYASVQKNVTSTCKVTAVNTKGTHPYHCISQDGKGVYGWVNAADVK